MGSPVVSIVTPTYNRAHTLERAIMSVRAQTLTDWQHIVVDDESTDGTPELLAKLCADRRYCTVRQENRGCIASVNRGALEARGHYLAFLDSDDEFLPHHLQDSIEVLESGADFVWGAAEAVGPEEAQYYDDVERPGERVHVSACCLNITIVLRRELWLAIGGYREVMSFDTDLKNRARAAGARIVQRTKPTVRVHCEGHDRLSRAISAVAGTHASTETAMPDQARVREVLRSK